MQVLSIADYVEPKLYDHFEPGLVGPIDLILSCGDLAPEYLAFLSHKLEAPLYYVHGNHDIRHDYRPLPGCLDVNGRLVHYNGISILGLEGSRWYNGGPHQYTEHQMRAMVRRLRLKIWWNRGLNVVLTHAPPRHIHDAEDECHKGFQVFRKLIDKYCPGYFIHGHIHTRFNDPAERVTQIGRTKVVNSYGYYLFEINPD